MSEPTNIPPDMWGSLLRIEGATARTEADVRNLSVGMTNLVTRVDHLEQSTDAVKSLVNRIDAERSQQVPEFRALITRVDSLEDSRTRADAQIEGAMKTSKFIWTAVAAVVAVLGYVGYKVEVAPDGKVATHQTRMVETVTVPHN